MLNPKENRFDYGEIVTMDGYELEFAIGTTYSLDFDALIALSMAMGLSEDTDSELLKNPLYILETLRKVSNKIVLFCQNGQIHFPQKKNELYILLEKMIYPIIIEKKGIYPSFHPKFWLLKFKNDEEEKVLYRVIVMSRNLTFDRSWDVVTYIDGEISGKDKTGNRDKTSPLINFIGKLNEHITDKLKKGRIENIIKELAKVEFKYDDGGYDFEFLAGGFEKLPLFNDEKIGYDEVIIISPFLSKGIIEKINDEKVKNNKEKNILITRKYSLEKDFSPDDLSNFSVYVMKDEVYEGESILSEEGVGSAPRFQDIHAKVYITRKGQKLNISIGSLNASNNAVHNNVEFMLKLSRNIQAKTFDNLRESIITKDNCPFEKITEWENSKDKDVDSDMEKLIKNILKANPSAEVIEQNNNKYSVEVKYFEEDSEIKDYNIKLKPLLCDDCCDYKRVIVFENLSITQLSEFYEIKVEKGDKKIHRVIMIPTKDIPSEREDVLVSKVIENQDNFFRYISYLMSNDKILNIIEGNLNSRDINRKNSETKNVINQGLYEQLLEATVEGKEKFKGIKYLVDSINKTEDKAKIIPGEFNKLYEIFEEVIDGPK